jgi:hypothetical protein
MAAHSRIHPGPEQFPVPDVIRRWACTAIKKVLSEKTFSVMIMPRIQNPVKN